MAHVGTKGGESRTDNVNMQHNVHNALASPAETELAHSSPCANWLNHNPHHHEGKNVRVSSTIEDGECGSNTHDLRWHTGGGKAYNTADDSASKLDGNISTCQENARGTVGNLA